jgi:thioredoxin 1
MSKFNDLINSAQPVLVGVYAKWCGPCKAMTPILKQVVGLINGKSRIIKIDIDKNPVVAQKYQVRGVSTLILFLKGEIK